jgi:hypothetical protein
LEAGKGNSFAGLMPENLEKLTSDMNLHVSLDKTDSKKEIASLIDRENLCYKMFVESHPEVMLPASLDDHVVEPVLVDNQESDSLNVNIHTPELSFKEAAASPPWTEVVRRGKTRSKSNKIDKYEGCTLQY